MDTNTKVPAPSKNAESQREYKQRMYDQGYKQKVIWVKREEKKKASSGTIDRTLFLSRLDELTATLTKSQLSRLFHSILTFVKDQTEVKKKKKKE
jgi:hypothetical protein